MRLRLPRRWILRAPIYLFCLLLVLIALDMVWVQVRRNIRPGFDTTRIMQPVQENGSIDYLAAIENYFGAGVTPQNNSAILILQALGRAALPNKQPVDGITNRMGMPHLPEQGDYFVTYDDFCKQHGAPIEADPLFPGSKIAFPPAVGAQTKQWIEANTKPLALITEASKRSRFFIPFNGGYRYEMVIEVMLPHARLLQEVPRALLTRAMLRLASGDFDGYHEDVMTVHRLARLIAQAPTLIERVPVAAMGIEVPVCEVERAAAASGRLSSEQARKMAGELAALGDLRPLDEAVNISERFMWLDALQFLAMSSPTEAGRMLNSLGGGMPVIEPPQAWWLIPVPFEQSMRAANHYYDGMLAVFRLPNYPERIEALRLWEDQAKSLGNHPVLTLVTADWMTAGILPSMLLAEEHIQSARMQNRLTQIALGLAAYKVDHGAYPASLDALVPSYLAAVPNDIFSEKPVIYAPTEKGYTLYSVGPNMTDDGGKSQKPADDIVANTP